MLATIKNQLIYRYTQVIASLINHRVCAFCRRVTKHTYQCPTCGYRQCGENCFPPGERRDGGQCGACEYPD